jgi:polar amino acid transport system substrate-binding protein
MQTLKWMGSVLCTVVMGMSMSHSNAQTNLSKPDVVKVAWVARPPFQYTDSLDSKQAKGSRLERVKQIFKLANIPAEFVEEPAKRIWSQLATGNGNYCSFDWYKLPEREAIAQFSNALEITAPYSILVSPNAYAQVVAHTHLDELLADAELSLGLLDGVSYGEELSALIQHSKNKAVRISASPSVMARMISANRASFMFINKYEWEYLKNNDALLNKAKLIDMYGVPVGQPSYLVCGKKMDAARMQKLNQAIEKLSLFN